MGLVERLRILESKVKPVTPVFEHHHDIDQCLLRLGLVPATVRELASGEGRSLAEATAEMLGVECGEFRRELKRISVIGALTA